MKNLQTKEPIITDQDLVRSLTLKVSKNVQVKNKNFIAWIFTKDNCEILLKHEMLYFHMM